MSTARANIKSEITANMSQFSSTLSRATTSAAIAGKKISSGIAGAAKGMVMLGAKAALAGAAVAAIGGAALVAGLKAAADLGGKVSDLSAQTGIAAGNILIMQRALEDNGISADKVGSIINKLQRSIYEAGKGIGTAVPAFEDLGINLDDLAKMTPEKQFETIQKKIAAIVDPTKRAALAMQIFGKSGGQLLTLFSDGEAFDKAGKFVGSQAEILNKSAVQFDAIADKLARIPDKLTGFFVGLLDPIADKVDAALTAFDNYDFAAIGSKIGESVSRGIDLITAAFETLSLDEMMSLATLTLKIGFINATNVLAKGISAVLEMFKDGSIGNMFEQIALRFKEMLLLVAAEISDSLAIAAEALPGGKNNRVAVGLRNAAHLARGSADVADAEREAMEEAGKSQKSFLDGFKDAYDGASNMLEVPASDLKELEAIYKKVTDAADKKAESGSQSDIYDAEREAQRKRVAEDMATMKEMSTPIGILGPSKSLMSKPKLPALGSDNVFARDRARLGIEGGLARNKDSAIPLSGAITGGLGAKRAFGQLSKDNGMKKSETLQEKSVNTLESIDQKISQSLTVA